MALSRTEIQKRSDEKRGIVQKNFKLPSETVELIKTEAERRGGVASRADCLGGQVFCGGVKNGNGESGNLKVLLLLRIAHHRQNDVSPFF